MLVMTPVRISVLIIVFMRRMMNSLMVGSRNWVIIFRGDVISYGLSDIYSDYLINPEMKQWRIYQLRIALTYYSKVRI